MRPYCVGLTGGIATGKSTVAECFAKLDMAIVDTDVISRELTSAGGAAMPFIAREFGDDFVTTTGALDRAAMRSYVFSNAEARLRLESILHPRIREAAAIQVSGAESPYVILVVPLLVEHLAEYRNLVDRILVVDCDEADQLRRLTARSALHETEAKAMISAQSSRSQRLALADDVIDNRGSLAFLKKQVALLHKMYMRDSMGFVDNSSKVHCKP